LSEEEKEKITRRKYLMYGGGIIVVAVVAAAGYGIYEATKPTPTPTPTYWPTQGWRTSTPEEQGFDSAKLTEGLQAIQQKGTKIHSLLIIRNDAVFLDAYFYPYDGSIYHDVASVTKSLTTTLIGIAAEQGKLDLDAPMLSFFPERTIANRDARKERITIRHLASMTAGLDCDERGDATTLEAMRASEDWVQFALDRRVVLEPGTRFVYCGLASHLLSAILQEATGMTALDFARVNLFEPLGIQDVYWPADPQGYTHGWGDVCLRPHDMAKLGFLFLHQGQWENRQIVSRAWVTDSTKRQAETGRGEYYGYGWWVSAPNDQFASFRADGRNGQYVTVVPSLNLVLTTTGGGFSMGEIDTYLVAAIGDTEKALPANSEGVARLQALVGELGKPPPAQTVPLLPETAQAISGKTYTFEANAIGLLWLLLDFDDTAEAILRWEFAGEPSVRVLGIGLDGVYRPSHGGRPAVGLGTWADPSTFVVDYNEGPGLATYTLRMHFDGNRLLLEIPGVGSFEGTLEQP